AKQLLGHMRDLVVLAVTAGEPGDLLDLVDEELAAATDLAKSVDVQELQRTFAGLSALVDEIARASVPRAVLEMGLVRLASRPRLESIATLMARVEDLARRAGGGPAPTGGGRPGGSASGPASAPPSRPTGSRGATASGPIAPQTAASPKPSPTNSAPSPRPASPKVAPEPPSTSVAAPATAPADPPTMDATEAWAKVVADVRDRKPAFGAVLEHALPVEVGPARVVLSFAEGAFYGRQAATPEGQGIISEGVGRAIGGSPKVEIRYHKDAPVAGKTVAQMEQTRRDEAREETRKRALNHPRVIEALQVFPEAAGNVKVQYENE
ncbi:MAG: hypothetical protein KC417_06760, partial [Myxococcales bacterium]|nr:hypothetical protein [Myxococcales bacterium]